MKSLSNTRRFTEENGEKNDSESSNQQRSINKSFHIKMKYAKKIFKKPLDKKKFIKLKTI